MFRFLNTRDSWKWLLHSVVWSYYKITTKQLDHVDKRRFTNKIKHIRLSPNRFIFYLRNLTSRSGPNFNLKNYKPYWVLNWFLTDLSELLLKFLFLKIIETKTERSEATLLYYLFVTIIVTLDKRESVKPDIWKG